jgi:glucose-6-phosphate 1-dehydrogenase
VARTFDERQVYRIDHYLGKETVQNILVVRLGNGIFEPLWNRRYVDHVQITAAESIGVEGRAAYYDQAGVLRDMFQNHILQLLCLVAMEPPVRFEADAVRDEKVKVLRALRTPARAEARRSVVRARYGAGAVGGAAVPGYLEEPGVPAGSETETFLAARVEIENWRWAGVPFFLRSGKRLPRRATEIALVFRRPPMLFFGGRGEGDVQRLRRNVLALRIQPDEGISLSFGSKLPGQQLHLEDVRMDFLYATSFGSDPPEAYEHLLLDCLQGDSTLFSRRDEIEEAWRIADELRASWEDGDGPSLLPYAAGSWGPEEADAVLGEHGRWRRV